MSRTPGSTWEAAGTVGCQGAERSGDILCGTVVHHEVEHSGDTVYGMVVHHEAEHRGKTLYGTAAHHGVECAGEALCGTVVYHQVECGGDTLYVMWGSFINARNFEEPVHLNHKHLDFGRKQEYPKEMWGNMQIAFFFLSVWL